MHMNKHNGHCPMHNIILLFDILNIYTTIKISMNIIIINKPLKGTLLDCFIIFSHKSIITYNTTSKF